MEILPIKKARITLAFIKFCW